jgi:hypothetical protein
MHLTMEIELGVPVQFNYGLKVLRENLHDYDISKAKLVSSYIIFNYPVHLVLSSSSSFGFLSCTKNTGFCVAST